MTWLDYLREMLPYAALLTAVLLLVGVVLTAAVQSRIAARNRNSSEIQAHDRLEHERLLAAQDRLFEPRAKIYVDALDKLTRLSELAYGAVPAGDEFYPGWEDEFSRTAFQALRIRMRVYGSPEAARLFETAWGSLWEAASLESTTHELRKQIRDAEDKWDKESINETRKEVETRANRHARSGFETYEEFATACQRDLASGAPGRP